MVRRRQGRESTRQMRSYARIANNRQPRISFLRGGRSSPFQHHKYLRNGDGLSPQAAAALKVQSRDVLLDRQRESRESPMLKAFWRVAPSVLLNFLAICDALVFLRAIVFSSRTSPEVHARRFFFLFAINPPCQESQLVSLPGAKEKPTDGMKATLAVGPCHHIVENGTAWQPNDRRYGKPS
jgi:hypothetical protein